MRTRRAVVRALHAISAGHGVWVVACVVLAPVTALRGFLAEADLARTEIVMAKVAETLEFYAVKHGGLPTTPEGLAAAAKYFPSNEVPVDAWGTEYAHVSDGTTFALVSFGKDGKPGTDDLVLLDAVARR